VSADGQLEHRHYATDFVEKSWPTNYSGLGSVPNFEGNRSVIVDAFCGTIRHAGRS
jgi:hypothetical protein